MNYLQSADMHSDSNEHITTRSCGASRCGKKFK
jgi:hypothetical protein